MPLKVPHRYNLKNNGMLPHRLFLEKDWRAVTAWLVAAIVFARVVMPMSLLMPLGLSEITICGAHGVETILVDQDMNRINPDAPPRPETAHCGTSHPERIFARPGAPR